MDEMWPRRPVSKAFSLPGMMTSAVRMAMVSSCVRVREAGAVTLAGAGRKLGDAAEPRAGGPVEHVIPLEGEPHVLARRDADVARHLRVDLAIRDLHAEARGLEEGKAHLAGDDALGSFRLLLAGYLDVLRTHADLHVAQPVALGHVPRVDQAQGRRSHVPVEERGHEEVSRALVDFLVGPDLLDPALVHDGHEVAQ